MTTASRPPALGFIFVTMLLDVMGVGLLIPVTPQLVASLVGGDASQAAAYYGPLVALFTAAQFVSAPILGTLSDQVGRKPVLQGSLLAMAAAYAALAFVPSIGWLLLVRGLSGAAAGSMTVASAYVADISTPENRARHFGMLGAAFGLGFILGPAIGGMLAGFGLMVPFLAACAVSLVNALYGFVAVPESHRPENRRAFGWDRANPLAFLTTLRRYPVVAGMIAGMLLIGLAQQCQQSTWVLFNTLQFHWTTAQNGASLALGGVCAVLVQGGLLRVVLPRLGERRTILVGLTVFAIAMALFGLASHGWFMVLVMILSSPAALAGPALQSLIAQQVASDEQGAVQGAVTSLMSLTGIVGPLMANQLFAFATAPASPVHLPGIAFFAGSGLLVLSLVMLQRAFAATARPQASPEAA